VVVGMATLVLLAASAAYRDVRKAALWVSALLLVIVSANAVYAILEPLRIAGWHPFRRRYVVTIAYLALLAWGAWLYRRQQPVAWLTGFANMLALGAVLPPAVILGIAAARESGVPASQPILAGTPVVKPDIYYLVFDRYGDDHIARATGLDNDIDEYLTDKGFYVPSASRSNYIKTVLSLASSLNAEYLDELARGRDASRDWSPVYARVEHHRVGAFLRSHGYSYTHLGSWYYPTRDNVIATRNVNYYISVPRPITRLFESLPLAPVNMVASEPWFDYRRQNWHRVRRQVEDVIRLAREPGPKFVFLHVLVPHPPYVFDRDGNYVTQDQEQRRTFAENYRNQVLAANAMIRRLVDGIQRQSAAPPVIIVQGDEGPFPPGTARDTFDWRTADPGLLRIRSGILNALYLPGVDSRMLYATMSPVNTFRVVFNSYLGTRLPLLPDRTFRHVSDYRPFPLEDITHLVSPARHAALSTTQ
jgi:hypothetical protein